MTRRFDIPVLHGRTGLDAAEEYAVISCAPGTPGLPGTFLVYVYRGEKNGVFPPRPNGFLFSYKLSKYREYREYRGPAIRCSGHPGTWCREYREVPGTGACRLPRHRAPGFTVPPKKNASQPRPTPAVKLPAMHTVEELCSTHPGALPQPPNRAQRRARVHSAGKLLCAKSLIPRPIPRSRRSGHALPSGGASHEATRPPDLIPQPAPEGVLGVWYVRAHFGEVEVNAQMDSGAWSCLIPKKLAERLGCKQVGIEGVRGVVGARSRCRCSRARHCRASRSSARHWGRSTADAHQRELRAHALDRSRLPAARR